MDRRAAVVYVLLSTEARIAGCYTLSSDSMDAADVPEGLIKQLDLPRYDRIGVTLLGRLARALAWKGQGLGELLLVDALKRAHAMSKHIASAGVVVDAKNDTAHRFYRDFGFIPFPDSEKRLFLPMATIEQM